MSKWGSKVAGVVLIVAGIRFLFGKRKGADIG
jgi:hypothetical protein